MCILLSAVDKGYSKLWQLETWRGDGVGKSMKLMPIEDKDNDMPRMLHKMKKLAYKKTCKYVLPHIIQKNEPKPTT